MLLFCRFMVNLRCVFCRKSAVPFPEVRKAPGIHTVQCRFALRNRLLTFRRINRLCGRESALLPQNRRCVYDEASSLFPVLKVNNIRYVARYIATRFYLLVKKAQLAHNIFRSDLYSSMSSCRHSPAPPRSIKSEGRPVEAA